MEFSSFIPYIIISAIAFIVSLYFLKWIFRVDETIKNQKTQIELLSKVAEKLGVDRDEIYNMLYTKK